MNAAYHHDPYEALRLYDQDQDESTKPRAPTVLFLCYRRIAHDSRRGLLTVQVQMLYRVRVPDRNR